MHSILPSNTVKLEGCRTWKNIIGQWGYWWKNMVYFRPRLTLAASWNWETQRATVFMLPREDQRCLLSLRVSISMRFWVKYPLLCFTYFLNISPGIVTFNRLRIGSPPIGSSTDLPEFVWAKDPLGHISLSASVGCTDSTVVQSCNNIKREDEIAYQHLLNGVLSIGQVF